MPQLREPARRESEHEEHEVLVAQMKAILEHLRKQYPSARATAEAEKIAREYAVP